LKLLIDDCFSPEVAHMLNDAGHDAVSASDDPSLRGRPDRELYAAAAEQGRVLVTENVVDFMPLAQEREARGEPHHGLALTSNERFPRSSADTTERVAAALHAEAGELGAGLVRWLQ
jgi:predicted nuclease of predicted toxin-antitoxin system